MEQSRALAVIVFTDIVGYSALMGSNETKAIEILRSNRNIHQNAVSSFRGIIIKELGDGILMRFDTVSDAVNCALAISKASQEIEGLDLKTGIHLGEIIEENADVFGDGVNIASRIESMARPGEILCSESVHRNLKNKESISTTFVKAARLKNIDEPVKVYRIGSGAAPAKMSVVKRKPIVIAVTTVIILIAGYFGFSWFMQYYLVPGVKPNDLSIAVLALDNKTPDITESYISDGISEELINKLTSVDRLEVRSARASFQFREPTDFDEVGQALNVRYLLEGSSAQAGNQLKISLRLVDLFNASNIWSETFTYSTDSIFSIQSKLATKVLEALEIELSLAEQNDLQSQNTSSSEAWDLHLQAMEHYNNGSEYEIQQAINKWFAALEIDEDFDLAARNIAGMYQLRVGRYDFGIEWIDSANLILDRLLEIDPKNPMFYRAKAWGAHMKGNYMEAEDLFEEAKKFAISRADLNRTVGNMYWTYFETGRLDEAFDSYLQLYRDFSSPTLDQKLEWVPMLATLYEMDFAKKIINDLKEENPENPQITFTEVQLSVLSGQNLEKNMKKVDSLARKLDVSDSRVNFIRGISRFFSGNNEEALHFFETSEVIRERTFADPHVYLAYIYKSQIPQAIALEGEETVAQRKFRENLEEAELRIMKMRELNDESYSVHYNLAAISLLKGDQDTAMTHLDSVFLAGYRLSTLMNIDPLWSEIRESTKFQNIVKQMESERVLAAESIRKKYNVDQIRDIPGLSEETFNKQILYGIGLNWEGETRVVNYTVEDSPADRAGLKAGDKIIEIAQGDQRFTKLENVAVRDQWRYFQLPPGETVLRFRVERKGVKDPIEMTMEKELVIFESQEQ